MTTFTFKSPRAMLCASVTVLLAACGGGSGGEASGTQDTTYLSSANTNPNSSGYVAPTTTTTTTRDPLKWPFASNSIWNMPIGSGAVYVPANLPAVPGGDIWAPMPQIDDERIVLRPTAPLTNINYSSAAWTGADRCGATGGLLTQVPMPSDYIIPNSNTNSSAVFLAADKRSLIHTQPVARCTAGGSATALVKWNPVDIYQYSSIKQVT